MKTVVSVQEISEFDIKPPEAVSKWKSLVQAEFSKLAKDQTTWITPAWPTCPPDAALPAFTNLGVEYVESRICGSLFALRRPPEDVVWKWYRESPAALYWREHILPESEPARRDKIARPRADWVLDGISEYVPQASTLVDLSTHGSTLVNLLAAEMGAGREITAAGMTADLETFDAKVRVKPARIRDMAALKADAVVAVDLFDRVSDLSALLSALHSMVTPGGVLFLTASVASGFEIQTLWEQSTTVMPPDKLNLPSVEALQKFFPAPAWEILELSTPGMCDVEMVRRAVSSAPNHSWPRFLRALVEKTDEIGRTALVELLQARRLASFARMVVRRNA